MVRISKNSLDAMAFVVSSTAECAVVSSNSSVDFATQSVSNSSYVPATSLPSPEFISAFGQAVHSAWNTVWASQASLSSQRFAPHASP